MNYKVEATPQFLTQAKKLSKKYSSLKTDLAALSESLSVTPEQGVSLGKNCFKVRLAITSKAKGKSGGARVIICIIKLNKIVYLSSLYDKSEKDTISDKELKQIVREVEETTEAKK
jgi:hypothetical protein